jgi:hypothetical protein
MLSVHGIAVSGPTFPATIWRLFMERALDYAPFPIAFPVAQTPPVWISHTLRYAMSGGYSTSSSGSYYYPPPTTTTPSTGSPSGGYTQTTTPTTTTPGH